MQAPVRLSIAILVALLVGPAGAREIHVNNQAGDDGATGHEAQNTAKRSGPVRTIAKALRLAQSGDHLVLANTGRPYRESVSLVGGRNSGTPVEHFVIRGNGAILDGSAPVPNDAWEHYRGECFRFRPMNTEGQQLFLKDRPLSRVIGSRVAEAPPELEPLQWCMHRGCIYFRVEHDRLPAEYGLTYAQKQTGITLYHVDCVTIADLTVQGFELDGINAFNSARLVRLVNVTCRGNGRSGVCVGGASIVDIHGSVIGNNGTAQLLTEPLSKTRVLQSRLLSNTAPAWVDRGGQVSIDGQPVHGGLDDRQQDAQEPASPAARKTAAHKPSPSPGKNR